MDNINDCLWKISKDIVPSAAAHWGKSPLQHWHFLSDSLLIVWEVFLVSCGVLLPWLSFPPACFPWLPSHWLFSHFLHPGVFQLKQFHVPSCFDSLAISPCPPMRPPTSSWQPLIYFISLQIDWFWTFHTRAHISVWPVCLASFTLCVKVQPFCGILPVLHSSL